MRSLSESAGPSGSSMRLFQVLPLTGVTADSAALATPGTPAAASRARRNSSGRAAGSSCARCALRLATRIGSRSKPRFRLASDENVRTNRPAATMSTSDSATCRTTSTLPRPSRPSPTTPRPCALSASFGCTRVPRSAGAIPNSTAVATATPAVNPSTRQSSERSRNTVLVDVDSCRTSRRLPHCAKTSPSSAPTPDSSRLSVSSCRAIRIRDAPSATRTLSSWRRAVARASSRFAMLAQAMSSTSADDHHDGGQRQAVALAQPRPAGGRGSQREALLEVCRPCPAGASPAASWLRGSAAGRPGAPSCRLRGFDPPSAGS